MSEIKKKDERSTNWSFEIYPSSADVNWQILLSDTLIPSLVSPLHDQDQNEDGTLKTPHYHVQLLYETKKSALEVLQTAFSVAMHGVGGCSSTDTHEPVEAIPIDRQHNYWQGLDSEGKATGVVLHVRSRSGMARYLCHLDHADKHQYNVDDIKVRGNIDLGMLIGRSYNKYICIREMMQFCKETNTIHFSELIEHAFVERPDDWFKVLCDSGSFIMKEYMRSLEYKQKTREEKVKEIRIVK